MLNGKFIIINGKLLNATYITSIKKISDDIEQEYIIRVDYVTKSYDDLFYDSAFKRDDEYNRILQELTNN